MRKSPVRATIVVLAALVLSVVFSGCGGGEPTTVSQQITAAGGATVSLGDDITLRIPAGALAEEATVTITRATEEEPAPGDLEGAKAVGEAFDIDLGGQGLSEPVTLEIAFDVDLLPEDSSEDVVFLGYYDEDAEEWVPVGGQVDQERNIVIIQTDHLSWWNPFSWNWEAWIAVLKKGLTLKLSEWLDAVQLLTEECNESGTNVTVDNSDSEHLLQGCVTKDDSSSPELRVINLKSFHIGIRSEGPGYPEAQTLGPGESAPFTASTGDQPPATVYADFTREAQWQMVVGLFARMIPGGDKIPDEGLAFIAEGLQGVFSAHDLSQELEAGDKDGIAESLYELITGEDFIETFVRLATQYGQKHGIEMMTKWDVALMKAKFVTGLVELTITATDYSANILVAAFFNNRSAVAFNWQQPIPSPTPAPPPTPQLPDAPSEDQRTDDAHSAALNECIGDLRANGFYDVDDGVLEGTVPDWVGVTHTYRVKDFAVTGLTQETLTSADETNGVAWKASVTVEWISREKRANGSWRDWRDHLTRFEVRMVRGSWEAERQPFSLSCTNRTAEPSL